MSQWYGIIRYSRQVLEYSLRYSPNTRIANYSDSTALVDRGTTAGQEACEVLADVLAVLATGPQIQGIRDKRIIPQTLIEVRSVRADDSVPTVPWSLFRNMYERTQRPGVQLARGLITRCKRPTRPLNDFL